MLFKISKELTNYAVRMMMDRAISKAEEFKIAVTVAIVDAGGHLLMLERMTGGRFHTVHSATTKAVTAASNRRPTAPRGAQGQPFDLQLAACLSLAAGPQRWTAIGGGYPVLFEHDCLGGIGVSGGTEEQDREIAASALAMIDATVES